MDVKKWVSFSGIVGTQRLAILYCNFCCLLFLSNYLPELKWNKKKFLRKQELETKKGSGDETPVELIVSSSQYLSGLTCQLHCSNFLPVSVNAVWLN